MTDPAAAHAGLFFSSLDTQQTIRDRDDLPVGQMLLAGGKEKAWKQKVRAVRVGGSPANEVETAFRHRGWLPDRRRVLEGLKRAGVPSGRLLRFLDCGANCSVHMKADGSVLRLSGRYCGDRFCVPCCNARARVVAENLHAWTKGQSTLFLTLTLRRSQRSLSEILRHLLASFQRLRDQKWWLEKVSGGAYVVEITRGAKGDHWHVHLHALVLSNFLEKSELISHWSVASKGSFIVDVQRVKTGSDQVNYVAEYATKGWSRECLKNVDWIVGLVRGLRGRRMLGTFGGWRGRRLEREEIDRTGWVDLGPLVRIVHAARRGECWAAGLLQGLNVKVVGSGRGIAFISGERYRSSRKD